MKATTRSLLVFCLALAGLALHAQSTAPTSSLSSLIAEARGLPLMQPGQVPIHGTYWVLEPWGINGVTPVPYPCPPFDPTMPIYALTPENQAENQIYLVDATVGTRPVLNPVLSRRLGPSYTLESVVEAQANLVVNLITQIQTAQAHLNQNGYPVFFGTNGFGTNGFGDGGLPVNSYVYTIDTNMLWLQITNISDGTVYANLYRATDYVYSVWSTTNLADPLPTWRVETEVFPTNPNCMTFTVSQAGRPDLFLRGQDWTGMSATGNVTELWWLYYYFGNAGLQLSDTNLDVWGSNTLVFDYTNGLAPTDYYGGFLPYLQTFSGDQQSGPLDAFLPQPLVVQVTDGFNNCLSNAPLTFSVTNGLNQLAATYGGPLATNLNVTTDGNGLARAWLFLPTNAPAVNYVTVTAHSGPYAEQLYFTAYEGEVAPPAISPAGGAFTVIQSVAVSCSTTGAVMHYTLDGTDPTEDDPAATNGQALLAPWTATLKVAAFADAILLPSAVSAADFTILHPLVAGRKHTLLLQPDETILAGGSNGSGQLGDGTTMDRTNLAGVLNLTNAVGIAAGALHSLAWAADGSAWAWGDNSSGQLGDGQSSGQQSSPTNLSGLSGVIQMSGGGQHSLALDGNHGVWAWGNNASGQLGDGATSPQTIPEQLNGLSNIVEVAAGGAHSLALAADETVRAWGNNASGQLGDGTSTQRTSPVMVGGLTNVLALAAGFNHSLALVSDETVRAWGDNTYGQLGDGTFTERNQPVKVLGVSNLVAIAAGEYHNLALKADGTVWSWGCNSHGQLGDGTTTTRIAPVPVSGLSNVLAIAAGWAHSAALKSDGTVVVWGSIPYGLNGDASANFSTVPVTEEPSVLVNWEPPTIAVQPFSQEVLAGDDVSFNVVATGTNLTYQWNLDGTPIPGANASVYALKNVQSGGNYTVTVGTGLNSVVSSNAVLTVDWGTGWPNLMEVLGQRLNYTFKNGVTYYIGSPVQLYGTTTIEGGAVLKFDYSLNSSLSVLGSLNCKTESYYPAFLTSVDDPCVGENIGYGYYPQPYLTGTPYLDLSQTTNASISNLRISYADLGVTTPAAGQLDIWDCQVLQCNSGVVNAFGGVDSLHNVLFAGCGDAVCAYTNNCTIMAEQMTADVSQFVSSSGASPRVSLTNSIILGGAGSVSPTNIQAVGAGNYYLAANSPLRQSGTTNLSRRLLGELKTRTTYPPVAMPSFMQLNGNLMLGLQAPRYTNGAPDLGYYYPAIDYTVSYLTNFGAITVLPGTVIGLSDQYIPNFGWTWWGFDLREGSSLVAHGMPNRPIVFVDAALVQEQFQLPVFGSLVPDYESPDSAPPVMDFRFCNFYASPECDHVWAGYDVWFSYEPSPDSLVNWTMRDCNLHGGWINLGCPDDGMFFGLSPLNFYGSAAVGWTNNSFDSVYFNLDPTWVWYPNYGDTINCDLAFSAVNNLSRNAGIFYLEPIPSSAGNWAFYNNFFDKADFLQDTNYQAIDYNYNGYWPLLPTELLWGGDASQLISSTPAGPATGSNEVVLATAPPYQHSYFGHFYLPTNTPLYGAGSDTAAKLGLFHYTTRPDQVKEGNDVMAAKPNASIGLHYIAATNGVPMDFDGDGIPDYVENWHGDGDYSQWVGIETDWQRPITDGYTPDPSNSIYLNLDLSGDGMVGAAKAALGVLPLDSSNPLNLDRGLTPSQLSGVITIPLQISSVVDQNTPFTLLVDGRDANSLVQCVNGNWFAQWDTTTIANGPHVLCLKLDWPDENNSAYLNDYYGGSTLATVNNPLTFRTSTGSFCELLVIDATVNNGANSFVVDVYDKQSSNLLTTLTGDVVNGQIQTNWDLTDGTGDIIVTGAVTCAFSLSNATSNGQNDTRTGITKIYPMLLPNGYNNTFTLAWGNDDDSSSIRDVYLSGMCNVVGLLNGFFDFSWDPTIDYWIVPPGGSGNVNDPGGGTSFTFSQGYPDSKDVLKWSLAQSGNFFWVGHGNPKYITPHQGVFSDQPNLTAGEIGQALLNACPYVSEPTNNDIMCTPYKLVILFACKAYSRDFANAFGIPDFEPARTASTSPITTPGLYPWDVEGYLAEGRSTNTVDYYASIGRPAQAYVGWPCNVNRPGTKSEANSEMNNIWASFNEWRTSDNHNIYPTISSCVLDLARFESVNLQYNPDPDRIIGVLKWELSGCWDIRITDRWP